MIKSITRRRIVATSLACAAMLPVLAMAQPDAWPNRPVRMLVPFPPGGGADFVARLVGHRLGLFVIDRVRRASEVRRIEQPQVSLRGEVQQRRRDLLAQRQHVAPRPRPEPQQPAL